MRSYRSSAISDFDVGPLLADQRRSQAHKTKRKVLNHSVRHALLRIEAISSSLVKRMRRFHDCMPAFSRNSGRTAPVLRATDACCIVRQGNVLRSAPRPRLTCFNEHSVQAVFHPLIIFIPAPGQSV